VVPEINDIAFVGVVHPEHGPGFDLWVGGGLSTNPMFAQRLGTWVSQDDIAEVWVNVVRIFRDWGYRRLRTRARLKFLVKDWGAAKFREVLESDEYLGRKLPDLDAPPVPEKLIDHIGVHKQNDGNFYIGVAPVAGRVSGTILEQLADIAEKYGSDRIRTTPLQKLLLLDVPGEHVADAVADLEAIGLVAEPSPWRRSTMACTGIEFCKLAIVETKNRARDLVAELEQRVPELDVPISIHLNGCPNACARTQTADIGLKGQLVTVDGQQVEGFQVHLGGGHAAAASLGRKSRGLKVSSAELGDYVERLTRRYLAARSAGETFAQWVHRADEEELQ
jgi:sulfite reductase (ferredoxin)